jgi:hypothetical protein
MHGLPQFELREWRQNGDGVWELDSVSPTAPGWLLQSGHGAFLLRQWADDPEWAEVVNATTGERWVTQGRSGRFHTSRRRSLMVSIAPQMGWITGSMEPIESAEAGENIGVDVWNLKTSRHYARLEPLPSMGVYFAARFSPDERYLVCTGQNGLAVYETAEFTVITLATPPWARSLSRMVRSWPSPSVSAGLSGYCPFLPAKPSACPCPWGRCRFRL